MDWSETVYMSGVKCSIITQFYILDNFRIYISRQTHIRERNPALE